MRTMGEMFDSESLYWLILAAAIVTYCTRAGGYWIMLCFNSIHPRVEAALKAVPAAVLATLVVPPALTRGPLEAITMLVAVVLCLRLNPGLVIIVGLVFLVAGRNLFGL